jgi:hypothetical protein|tara:strand:+ start:1408 stop:1521 length:114 start_codon:yes stop_codon:yes gene_type:complete
MWSVRRAVTLGFGHDRVGRWQAKYDYLALTYKLACLE